MGRDTGRPARALTFALMAAAYAGCEVAAYPDGIPRAFGVVYGLFLLAAAVAASYFVPEPKADAARLPRSATAALAAGLVLPVLAEPAVREATANGLPLELQLVNGLRNAGLILAAFAAWPQARRLAGLTALFLILFTSAMGDQAAIPYLLGALAVLGGLWLVADHRAAVADVSAAVADAAVEPVALRVPVRELAVFAGLVAAAVGVAAAGPKRVVAALGELVPTSGGTGAADPFSRGGVNDGPEEAAGSDPTASGMVDSDTLIESEQDSLIDALSDMSYGPPHRPRRNAERMVSGGLERVKQSHKTPENKRPSRDFDTGRQTPPQARRPPGQDARALFEVEGRTPLHVRLVAYGRYDAAAARWAEDDRPRTRQIDPEEEGGEWMVPRTGGGRRAWYAADDSHRLKVADFRESLVPTPALTARFRIRRVTRPEYYAADGDGVWSLEGRRRIPSGTVVHAECRTLDPADVPAAGFAVGLSDEAHAAVPPELHSALAALAREWAGDAPRGWPQVAAIRDRLRAEYAHDRTAAAPAGHPAPVLWFLTDGKRGPDYLFAAAAALLLRTLDYPTRVCLGFYADPASYDAETDHTPVRAEHLHVWPEVRLSDGHWLPVEPTPGYGVLPPLRPWRERVAETLRSAAARVVRNALPLTAGVLLAAAAVWKRRRLADAAATCAWRIAPGRTWERAAVRTARLLEYRGRLAGHPRGPAATLVEWADELGGESAGELARLCEWAAFAPGLTPPVPPAGVLSVCRTAAAEWTLARLTATARGT